MMGRMSKDKGQPAGLRIYSRPGCHLCEELIEALLPMIRDRLPLEVVDIDSRPDWAAAYGSRIPVVEFNGEFVCQYALDATAVSDILQCQPES